MALARSAISTAALLKLPATPSIASTSRLFTTSVPALGKSPPGKGKNAVKNRKRAERESKMIAAGVAPRKVVKPMDLEEATRLFQAVEVTRPLNAYELHIVTSVPANQTNALRGRLALPKEARVKSEKFLVFAEDGSEVAEAITRIQETSPSMRNSIVVGGAELVQDVVDGTGAAKGLSYTKVLSTQSLLPRVSKALARSLGPKGLMPNAKRGTIVNTATDMQRALKESQGAVDWRGDRNGVVRGAVGRINFSTPELRTNISAFLQAIIDKVSNGLTGGSAATGIFQATEEPGKMTVQAIKRANKVVRQIHLSSTQGPSVLLSLPEVV